MSFAGKNVYSCLIITKSVGLITFMLKKPTILFEEVLEKLCMEHFFILN